MTASPDRTRPARGAALGAAWLVPALIACAYPVAAGAQQVAPVPTPAPALAQPADAAPRSVWSGPFAPARATGPALAPTEPDTSDLPLADGTSASILSAAAPAPARRPVVFRDSGSPDDGEATLLADNVDLTGDRQIAASGGVVIWFQGSRLIADRVVYDQRNGTMQIDGPIHLTQPALAGTPDETVLIADAAQMDEGLRDGILRGARLVLARETQLAAAEVRRSGNGRMTTLTHVVASSCQVCASDPVPLWEIRARRITHDAETRRIQFERAQFRAFGLPVAALPAFSAPDPTVERMTGFLRPQLRTTSGLGVGLKLPYFITLGDSADLTLTPYLAANWTTTLGVRYRQAFRSGEMEWEGAISRDDIVPGDTRGYLFGGARFALPRDYRLGIQVQTASDRAYLLDYDITDADRLWSGVTLERVARDRLLTARIGHYQTLREDERQSTSPALVADALWERRFAPPVLGGEGGIAFSAHAHRRSSGEDIKGRDMARGSARLGWRRGGILPGGVLATGIARLDADLYRIRQDGRFDSSEARVEPTAGVELRWPLIARSGDATNILEPVAQIVWSPELRPEETVPNDDSRLIEFDEGNLFSLNRMPGYDLRESGLRANLGIGWTRIDPTGWSLGVTAGRVLRADRDPAFALAGDILSGKRSDWLLAATYSGNQGLAIANRALFDDSFSLDRNEMRVGWLRPGFQLTAGYLWIDASTFEQLDRDVSELTATTGWQAAPGWWATAETRYDFSADRAQTAEVGIRYRNECVTVDFAVERRFTSSENVRPDTDLDLSVRLGGFGRTRDTGPGTVARRSCLR